MSGDKQDADGDGNTQIGGDGVLAEELERSNVAGGDIRQTNVYHGVEPGEHAKLISRIAQLESSVGGSVDPDIIEPEEDEGELTPIRETGFYKKSLGKMKNATSFSAVAIILSLILFVYAMESPTMIADYELRECEEGVIQPEDIHSDFAGWTCEEVAEYSSANRGIWDIFDSALLISILLFPMALISLWRPAWNPVRILDMRIGELRTPYRTVGLLLLFLSFQLILVFTFSVPEQGEAGYVSGIETTFFSASCCTFLIGLNLLFLSASKDESGSVTMEPGVDGVHGV